MLDDCGADAVKVRTAADLAAVDALVIPGGESTTIGMLIRRNDLEGPLRRPSPADCRSWARARA